MPRYATNKKEAPLLGALLNFKKCFSNLVFVTVNRPILTLFLGSLIVFIYSTMKNEKIQQTLCSLPYDKYFAKVKSQRMITIYASIMEVLLELCMAIILGGVSVIVTLWLMVEEMAEKKTKIHKSIEIAGKTEAKETQPSLRGSPNGPSKIIPTKQ